MIDFLNVFLVFLDSVDLDHPVDDTSKDPTLSKELLQALNEYLAQKRRSGSLETLSPAVRDFLALQRLREIFPATEMNPVSCITHVLHRIITATLLFLVSRRTKSRQEQPCCHSIRLPGRPQS